MLKSALKMQEMPFQRPKFQNISGVKSVGVKKMKREREEDIQ